VQAAGTLTPVTGMSSNSAMNSDDVSRAVMLARETLAAAADRDWQIPAGLLDWSCWETVEHMSDDLFVYAAQLGPAKPALDTHVPFGWQRRRDGGPALTIFVDPAEGPAGLLEVFETCGTMLAAMVGFVPPDRQSFHNYGPSDTGGFAAMGVVEVLVHTHDVATGLGLDWSPPADLCAAALRRLFPSAPPGGEAWPTLLWVTGRGELPGRPRQVSWTWDGAPD
jgi:Mycothiol maleylpyruvate isomerase N-terminal domain